MVENGTILPWLVTGYGDTRPNEFADNSLKMSRRSKAPVIFREEISNLYTTDYFIKEDERLNLAIMGRVLPHEQRFDLGQINPQDKEDEISLRSLQQSLQIESLNYHHSDTGKYFKMTSVVENYIGAKVHTYIIPNGHKISPSASILKTCSGDTVYAISMFWPNVTEDLIAPIHEYGHLIGAHRSVFHRDFFKNPDPSITDEMTLETDTWMIALDLMEEAGISKKLKSSGQDASLTDYIMYTILTRIPGKQLFYRK